MGEFLLERMSCDRAHRDRGTWDGLGRAPARFIWQAAARGRMLPL